MLKAWGMKDIGKCRSDQSDYIYVSEEPVGNLPNLFLVADGMGGHKAGDLASEYTVAKVEEAVSKSMQTEPLSDSEGRVPVREPKAAGESQRIDQLDGMGTTPGWRATG